MEFLVFWKIHGVSHTLTAAADIRDSEHKEFHTMLMFSQPEDFWSKFQTASLKQYFNTMFSAPLMCSYFCNFSLFSTLARNYGIFYPALLFDIELSL